MRKQILCPLINGSNGTLAGVGWQQEETIGGKALWFAYGGYGGGETTRFSGMVRELLGEKTATIRTYHLGRVGTPTVGLVCA